jgi:ppGpp synthetase/RelA/SpoT-type nucleotidyltranferase
LGLGIGDLGLGILGLGWDWFKAPLLGKAIIYLTHQPRELIINGVAYTEPEYSKNQVKNAGTSLASTQIPDSEVLAIVNNCRAAHQYPLTVARKTLEKRALSVDRNAITVQRLKRLPSIKSKLQRLTTMKLSTMQDIGGCRAIVDDLDSLKVLLWKYYSMRSQRTFVFVKENNYVKTPKADGYRGHHLVYEYQSSAVPSLNGLKIEIQLRTRLQHAWATAVEVASTATNQVLKSGIGTDQWKRFFFLAGRALSLLETRFSRHHEFLEFMPELYGLWMDLGVEAILESFTTFIQPPQGSANPRHVILLLNLENRKIQIVGFERPREAIRQYNELERQFDSNVWQIVLVMTDSIQQLEAAYPNYWMDTREFLRQIRYSIEIWQELIESLKRQLGK